MAARCYGLRPTWGDIKTLADDNFEIVGLEPGRPRLVIFADQTRRWWGRLSLTIRTSKRHRRWSSSSIRRLRSRDDWSTRTACLWRRLESESSRMTSTGSTSPRVPIMEAYYCLWPDGEIFVSDSDGRFRIDGLKPGVKSSLNIENTVRPVLYHSINDLLHKTDIKPGEVRDVGDVAIKEVPVPERQSSSKSVVSRKNLAGYSFASPITR